MSKRTAAIILLLFAVMTIACWMMFGMHFWTSSQHMAPVTDALFGTTSQEWVTEFQPGLELLGTIAAVFVAAALALLWLDRRGRQP